MVGTPIGNLEDVTFRAIETLKNVSCIFAEDTRHTRKLLNRYEIKTFLKSCHTFSEISRIDVLIQSIGSGQAIAVVTDAGMPGISDPGSRIVQACRRAGVFVTVVPGPSAVTAALALSGLGGSHFMFLGFLSHKRGARKRCLNDWMDYQGPLVLYESPYRLLKLMDEIEEIMGDRNIFVGRELTKKFEETLWGTPSTIRLAFKGRAVKGELTVIIAPRTRVHGDD